LNVDDKKIEKNVKINNSVGQFSLPELPSLPCSTAEEEY
jgi:hypothetical protein